MSCGKIAGQVAHAAVRSLFLKTPAERFLPWFEQGETKIVLKVKSEEELLEVAERCAELGMEFAPVRDLGKTQIEEGTLTAIGIGPYPDEMIDNLTKDLKLL